MTDIEIVNALIERDEMVTREFFFQRCKPLFYNIITMIFPCEVDYDEFVNELYIHLMENDAARLKSFQNKSSIYQWLKILAIRFFIRKRGKLIENTSKESQYIMKEEGEESSVEAKGDVERLLEAMPNQRYAEVIRRLILDDCDPDSLAEEMNIKTTNLYNIKRRAILQLTEIALKDIRQYEVQYI